MEELDLGEVIKLIEEKGLEATLKQINMTEEELRDWGGYPLGQVLDGTEGVNSSMNEGINPEWEGKGIESELIPGESALSDTILYLAEKAGIPPEAALVMAGITGKNPKNVKKGVDGMLSTPKMKKTKNEPFKTSKSGEVVGDATSNIGKAKANAKSGQSMQKRFGDADKNTKQLQKVDSKGGALATRKEEPWKKVGLSDNAKAGLTAGGIATAIGLMGDRDKDGSLKPAAPKVEEPDYDVFDEDRLDPPTGPDMAENQFGYHKKEGQNFWTIDDSDPYWDTHEKEGSSPWEEGPLKEEKGEEFDTDYWFGDILKSK